MLSSAPHRPASSLAARLATALAGGLALALAEASKDPANGPAGHSTSALEAVRALLEAPLNWSPLDAGRCPYNNNTKQLENLDNKYSTSCSKPPFPFGAYEGFSYCQPAQQIQQRVLHRNSLWLRFSACANMRLQQTTMFVDDLAPVRGAESARRRDGYCQTVDIESVDHAPLQCFFLWQVSGTLVWPFTLQRLLQSPFGNYDQCHPWPGICLDRATTRF